ncbi:hypothetical protein M513_13599 [Trichuris suis]|uniref:Uncharacterized protein n=1 Tax=Trichuris suis TaxID=68888 RepID=A0A085LKM8_9BILA|nr:hypothetical protein M513_13599 [Trichuris suis]
MNTELNTEPRLSRDQKAGKSASQSRFEKVKMNNEETPTNSSSRNGCNPFEALKSSSNSEKGCSLIRVDPELVHRELSQSELRGYLEYVMHVSIDGSQESCIPPSLINEFDLLMLSHDCSFDRWLNLSELVTWEVVSNFLQDGMTERSVSLLGADATSVPSRDVFDRIGDRSNPQNLGLVKYILTCCRRAHTQRDVGNHDKAYA